MDPTIGEGGICRNFNSRVKCSREPCQYQHLCNTCNGKQPGFNCPSDNLKSGKSDELASKRVPTPIKIQYLQAAQSGNLDPNFVTKLCNNFTLGLRIGFRGQRGPRFSKNLPTAFANPDVVL